MLAIKTRSGISQPSAFSFVKNFLKFLSYVPVILVAIFGAYIVFHMWQLTEIGRKGHRNVTITSSPNASSASRENPATGNASESPETSPSPAGH
jgi:hypothetical protein